MRPGERPAAATVRGARIGSTAARSRASSAASCARATCWKSAPRAAAGTAGHAADSDRVVLAEAGRRLHRSVGLAPGGGLDAGLPADDTGRTGALGLEGQ